MSFCGKCGSDLEPGVKFCGKCGQVISSNNETIKPMKEENENLSFHSNDVNSRDTIQTENNKGINKLLASKKNKIIFGSIVAVLLAFGVLWYIGSENSKPSKIVESFNSAIASEDKSKIAELIYCSDSKLELSEKSVEPLLNYLKDNPSYSKNTIDELKKQALNLETNKSLSAIVNNKNSNTFNIVENGKKFLFFPNYKVEIKPIYVQISTGVKDVTFTLNDEEIGKSDVDNFTKEYGPYIPGKYKLVSTYSGKYVSLNEDHDINTIAASDQKVKIEVFESLSYVKVSSDYPEAQIYVNDKDTGIKVSEAQNFGPLSKDTKVYGVINKNGKTVKSSVYTVMQGDTSIYLNFQQAENEIKEIEMQVYSLIDNYTYYFTKAINYDDFSYVEPFLYPGSAIYNDQKTYIPNTYKNGIREEVKSFKIKSYTISDDNKSGTISTEEIYSIEKDGKSSIKTFNYKYTFKYNESKNGFQLDTIDTSGN